MWLSGKACWMQHLLLDKSHFITEVLCPFLWTNETQRPSDLNRYSRIQSPACSNSSEADVLHTDRKCTDGFEPSRMVLQTTLITRSCAQRWTVFELNELLRIFSPPLLPSQLTVLFCRITPTVEKQDTKNSMIKSHGAIGWNCCMCPTARWIGFEPITSAFGKQFWYFCCEVYPL